MVTQKKKVELVVHKKGLFTFRQSKSVEIYVIILYILQLNINKIEVVNAKNMQKNVKQLRENTFLYKIKK